MMTWLSLFLIVSICFSEIGSSAMLRNLMSTGESPGDFVQRQIDDGEVTVFSKTYCPYCSATKKLLHSLGSEDELDIRINIVELDEMETHDAANVKSHLFDMTGQMTFPNVFFGETHIGGNDNAQELARSGLLKRMLEKIASSRDEF